MRAWLLIGLVVACGPSAKHQGNPDGGGSGSADAGPLPHTLTGISVTPTNPIVELDLNSSAIQGFTATANYADGVDEDVTTMVNWAAMNPAVGSMTGSNLNIPGFASAQAVTSLITADYNGTMGQAQITVVAYRLNQDFFFVLPYQDPMGTQTKPLQFATAIPKLDVFFDMDTTGSMSGEILNLKNSLNSTIVPGIQGALPDTQFGVGAMEDFPVDGYGNTACSSDGTNDEPFKLRQVITSNIAQVTAGVNSLLTASNAPIGCGGDTPEGGLESIYQAATGEGLSGPPPTNVPANSVGIGGVGFRTGTMPVIVAISDAPSHGVGETGTACGTWAYDATVAPYAHSRAQVKTALTNICARSVGIAAIASTCNADAYMQDLATATGARVPPAAWDVGMRPANCGSTQCCTGQGGVGRAPDVDGLCPLSFLAGSDGTGVGASIVTGIQMLTRFATFTVTSAKSGVTTDVNGVTIPGGHNTSEFIKAVTPQSFVLPPPPPTLPTPTFDTMKFYTVTPGTKVTFGLDALNDFVMQTDQAQIFRANVQVLAGGCTPLDNRDVLILVPPVPIAVE
jgi:hypothetical protein